MFTKDKMLNGLTHYALLTIIISFGSLVFLNFFGTPLINLWQTLYPSPIILVILAFLQEAFFRKWLMLKLKSRYKNVMVVIMIDAAIFAVAHLIFPFREILVPGAFLVGLGFAAVYYYYPNLLLAGTSHSILNLIIIPICKYRIISCLI